jgi:hypothetical protein
MDFFIPSLFVLLFAGILVFLVIPRFGLVSMIIISIILLFFSVSHHIKMFKSEYTLSTWPMLLSTYGPYFVLGSLLLFILFFIFSSFGSASVPVPEMPSIPNTTSIASSANSIINSIKTTVSNVTNNIIGNNSLNKKNNVRKSFFNVI